MDWAKVKLFVWETAHLDAPLARAVDAVVLGPVADAGRLAGIDVLDVLADPAAPGTGVPVIARWTLQQLKDAIRAAILELDAAAAAKRVAAGPPGAACAGRRERGRHRRPDREPARRGRRRGVRRPDDGGQGRESRGRPPHPGPVARRRTRPPRHPRVHPDEHRPGEYRPTDTDGIADADSGADSEADSDANSDADAATDSGTGSRAGAGADPGADPDSQPPGRSSGQGGSLPEGVARCGCGRAVPVTVVPSFTAAHAGAPAKSTLVSLTMPLSTFLGLADQPGRLDGYGPVPAGLARRIAADAAREQPAFTAWRCIITDDVHGSVLGVTDPIWTPGTTRHPG